MKKPRAAALPTLASRRGRRLVGRKPKLELTDRLTTGSSTESSPRSEVNAGRDEPRGAIEQQEIDSRGMSTASGEDAPAAGAHVGYVAVRAMEMVIGGPVFAAIDPSGSALSGPAGEHATRHAVSFKGRFVSALKWLT